MNDERRGAGFTLWPEKKASKIEPESLIRSKALLSQEEALGENAQEQTGESEIGVCSNEGRETTGVWAWFWTQNF